MSLSIKWEMSVQSGEITLDYENLNTTKELFDNMSEEEQKELIEEYVLNIDGGYPCLDTFVQND